MAYGGPDLSDRNLRMLASATRGSSGGEIAASPLEISATGDVSSGRMAVEYALRGCTSFQIHTLFQLPAEEFAMRRGSKIERAIHRLYFDADEGFIVWAAHAARRLGLATLGGGTIRFLDLARRARISFRCPGPRLQAVVVPRPGWACRDSARPEDPRRVRPRRWPGRHR